MNGREKKKLVFTDEQAVIIRETHSGWMVRRTFMRRDLPCPIGCGTTVLAALKALKRNERKLARA